MPRLRAYFGRESDLNGDGLVALLFSPLVAKLAAGVIAYVSPCDLLDRVEVPFCAASNRMELLYIAPPSGSSSLAQNPRRLRETAAHELQHAIYFFQVHRAQLGGRREPLRHRGLQRAGRGLERLPVGAGLHVAATLQGVNHAQRAHADLGDCSRLPPNPAMSGCHYGGGYLLMRYLFDRAGGDGLDSQGPPNDMGGMSWLHSRSTAGPGLDSLAPPAASRPPIWRRPLDRAGGQQPRPGGGRSAATSKLNFRLITTDPITGRQRGCNLFVEVHGTALGGPATQPLRAADGTLRAGGAEFLTLRASPRPAAARLLHPDPAGRKARVR